MPSVWPSPSPRKDKWWLAVAAAIFAAGPWLLGFAMTPAGREFVGTYAKAPGDTTVYYRYIDEGRTGGPVMIDGFTAEPHRPILWQPLWWAVGRAAELKNLETPAAFALTRVLLSIVLALVVSWGAGWVFSDRRTRLVASWTGYFGAGIGGLLALFSPGAQKLLPAPVYDLWVSEGYPWLSSLASPHFLFVTAGLVFVVVGVEYAWQERWVRWIAGPVFLLVLSVHPFHTLTIGITWTMLTALDVLRRSPDAWRKVRQRAAVASWSIPVLMYYLLMSQAPLMSGRAAQNINPTYIWPMILGVLPLLVLAVATFWKKTPGLAIWFIWAVALALVVIAPVPWPRRFFHPASLIVAWLAAPIISSWLGQGNWRRIVMIIVLVIMILSPVTIIRDSYKLFQYSRQQPYQTLSYVTEDFIYARELLRTHPEWSPVLTGNLNGNLLAASAPIRPYAAHAVETLQYQAKAKEIERFFGPMSLVDQEMWLRARGICSILVTPYEQVFGAEFSTCPVIGCHKALETPTVTLWVTGLCS